MDCRRLKHAASFGVSLDDEDNLFKMSVVVNIISHK